MSVSSFSRDDLKTLLARAVDPVDAPEEMDFTRITRDPHDYDPAYVSTLREAGVLAPVMDREARCGITPARLRNLRPLPLGPLRPLPRPQGTR